MQWCFRTGIRKVRSTYNVSNIFTCIYLCTTTPLAMSLLSNECPGGKGEKLSQQLCSFEILFIQRPTDCWSGRDLRHHLVQSSLHRWGNWWSGFWEGTDRMPPSCALVKTNNPGSVGVRNQRHGSVITLTRLWICNVCSTGCYMIASHKASRTYSQNILYK